MNQAGFVRNEHINKGGDGGGESAARGVEAKRMKIGGDEAGVGGGELSPTPTPPGTGPRSPPPWQSADYSPDCHSR